MSLSVVIICQNEARNIAKCIASAKQVSDDIIVVDSGSTDDTIAIAQSRGARVFNHDWEGYGTTKNFGNQQAKHSWILSLDADEVLSDELISTIKNLKVKESYVYALDRMMWYEGQWIRHSGWYPKPVVRIFHNSITWDSKEVHEQLIIPEGTAIKKLEGILEHYSYASKDDHLERINKYAKLTASEWHKNGKRPSFVKRVLGPGFRFMKTYFIQLGILDGKAGLQIARLNYQMIKLRFRYYDELKSNS